MLGQEELTIVVRLGVALLAGLMIGFERSYHGRPAGFRTHALVSLASALLMLVTVYQNEWMTVVPIEAIRTDPTRMAQGIMTGIGFLGAGVIYKEGLTVRGLTTSASIWLTASIGILIGVGFYFPAAVGTLMTLAVLAGFRIVEMRMPSEFYAHLWLSFERSAVLDEDAVRALLKQHGFTIGSLAYRLTDSGTVFAYRMVIRTKRRKGAEELAAHLRGVPTVAEFRLSPAVD
jgi:putative Mg2+ transporter-C (MgtC) family protein